jgi:hypothetical protein
VAATQRKIIAMGTAVVARIMKVVAITIITVKTIVELTQTKVRRTQRITLIRITVRVIKPSLRVKVVQELQIQGSTANRKATPAMPTIAKSFTDA